MKNINQKTKFKKKTDSTINMNIWLGSHIYIAMPVFHNLVHWDLNST